MYTPCVTFNVEGFFLLKIKEFNKSNKFNDTLVTNTEQLRDGNTLVNTFTCSVYNYSSALGKFNFR